MSEIKVGDKVKINCNDRRVDGKTGVILSYDEEQTCPYEVTVDELPFSAMQYEWRFMPDELQPVVASEPVQRLEDLAPELQAAMLALHKTPSSLVDNEVFVLLRDAGLILNRRPYAKNDRISLRGAAMVADYQRRHEANEARQAASVEDTKDDFSYPNGIQIAVMAIQLRKLKSELDEARAANVALVAENRLLKIDNEQKRSTIARLLEEIAKSDSK